MSYYPLPDIPADATPDVRRFCEQTRSVIAALEKFGQMIEVHQPITAPPDYNGLLILDEFPVYRADVPVELVSAYWTFPNSEAVSHDIVIFRRNAAGSTVTPIADIRSASAGTTDWVAYLPKRFRDVAKSRRVLPGQVLTIAIAEIVGATTHPWGLLSLYLRRAEGS